MKKIVTTLFLLLMIVGSVYAQDRIIRKNTLDTISCKISEIGEDVVKYTSTEYAKDIKFSINQSSIVKIIFEDGKEMNFLNKTITEKELALNHQRKNALKVSTTSPWMGASIFSYERSITPTRSVEIGLGIVGLGVDINESSPEGFILKFGYKFKQSPLRQANNGKYAHILKGGYIKPEVTFVSFSEESYYYYDGYDFHTNSTNTMFAATCVLGKQWVYADRISIDLFVGTGFGFGTNNCDTAWHYGFLGANDGTPLVFTAGFKFGFLF